MQTRRILCQSRSQVMRLHAVTNVRRLHMNLSPIFRITWCSTSYCLSAKQAPLLCICTSASSCLPSLTRALMQSVPAGVLLRGSLVIEIRVSVGNAPLVFKRRPRRPFQGQRVSNILVRILVLLSLLMDSASMALSQAMSFFVCIGSRCSG